MPLGPRSQAAISSHFFLRRQRLPHVACRLWVLGAGLRGAMILSMLTGAERLAVWLMRHLPKVVLLVGDGGLQWALSLIVDTF